MCSVELISTNTTLYESKNDLKAAEPGAKSARLGRGSSRDGAGDVRRWQREGPHRTVLGRVGPRTRKSRGLRAAACSARDRKRARARAPGGDSREAQRQLGRKSRGPRGKEKGREARRGPQEAPDAAASPARKKKGMKVICV